MLSVPGNSGWGRIDTRQAILYLNGRPVGKVRLRSRDGSWRFGRFTPDASFSQFAGCFADWSRALHTGGEDAPLDDLSRRRLRMAERTIDGIHASILPADGGPPRRILLLNIDGPLIEWKEG